MIFANYSFVSGLKLANSWHIFKPDFVENVASNEKTLFFIFDLVFLRRIIFVCRIGNTPAEH